MSRPAFDYRYSIIPGGAVTDPNVSMRDLQVLALLGRHTDKKGWCWRSQVEMAAELRCGRATISRSIKRLVDAGWLEQEALPRGRTVHVKGQQPFSAFKYRVKIDREDECDAPSAGDVPNNGHPRDVPENGQEVPIADGHGVPIQTGTHRRTPFKDPLNSLAPADAVENAMVASLREGEVARWPEFRSVVDKSWPGGFPPKDEVACRKQFDPLARERGADLLMACAQLHGDEERRIAEARTRGAGKAMLKRPSNWLREGEWQGYIPQAEALAAQLAEMATALGRVRRSLGDGIFRLFRERMGDAGLAALAGVTIEPKAHFLYTRPVQRTLMERHSGAIERHLGEPPTFTLVAERKAS